MIETQAKYHHLVPQTYMSAWVHGNGTLNVEFIHNPGKIVPRNKDNIAGITDFHSIKAGMPICTKTDADTIFESVLSYFIEYDGKEIQDTLEMNKLYYDFDNWHITRADGTVVSKKKLKREIEKVKIKDIEANWSAKYKNKWGGVVSLIEQKVLNTTDESIEEFEREFITMFFTALDWRGFNSNKQFEEMFSSICLNIQLDKIEIPEEERVLPSLKTAADEMRHYLLLKYYRQYLCNTGVIYQNAIAHLKHTSFHFFVSDGPTQFLTSDTPVFMHNLFDGKMMGLLPITPKILMMQGRCSEDNDRYYITHITDQEVRHYNEAIRCNADEFVIIP